MPSRVLLLHGPNLNLQFNLAEIDAALERHAQKLGFQLITFQANSEGGLVDALHAERTRAAGVIVNAARLAPSAEVLAEALSLVKRPAVEVLTDAALKSRSALRSVVFKQVTGKDAYAQALELLGSALKADQARPTRSLLPVSEPGATVAEDDTDGSTRPISRDEVKKTLGRRAASEKAAAAGGKKSIGRADERRSTSGTHDAYGLTRALVREKIAERLSGKLSPAGLATWARTQWQQMQRGSPVESGQRERLEDVLQTLLLSAASKANDHQLIELMTQLA